MAAYSLGIVGVLVLCLVSILLAVYSGSSKGSAGAISGPVLPLDDGLTMSVRRGKPKVAGRALRECPISKVSNLQKDISFDWVQRLPDAGPG